MANGREQLELDLLAEARAGRISNDRKVMGALARELDRLVERVGVLEGKKAS